MSSSLREPGLRARLRWDTPARLVAWMLGVVAVLAITAGGHSRPDRIDLTVTRHAHQLLVGRHVLVDLTKTVTFFGSSQLLTPLVVACVVLLVLRRMWRQACVVGLVAVATSLIVTGLKVAFARPRPVFTEQAVHAGGYAFPSGHAADSTAVYGILLIVGLPFVAERFRRLCVRVVVGLIAAIGVSRLLLGVHWLTDVIAGVCLGVAIVTVARTALPVEPPAS